tara:strand:- start:317 stop:502 length:186 start_codon:yes stop_codon:yes gene_type:complete
MSTTPQQFEDLDSAVNWLHENNATHVIPADASKEQVIHIASLYRHNWEALSSVTIDYGILD